MSEKGKPREPVWAYWSQMATSAAMEGIDRRRKALANCDADTDRAARLRHRRCKTCHYFHSSGMTVGPTKETTKCSVCSEEFSFTYLVALVKVCPACTENYSLCSQCGADRDLNENRRDWSRKTPPPSKAP